MVGALRKSKVPDASPGPTSRASLSERAQPPANFCSEAVCVDARVPTDPEGCPRRDVRNRTANCVGRQVTFRPCCARHVRLLCVLPVQSSAPRVSLCMRNGRLRDCPAASLPLVTSLTIDRAGVEGGGTLRPEPFPHPLLPRPMSVGSGGWC